MKYKIYRLIHNDNVIYVGYTKQRLLCMRKAGRYRNIPIDIKKESIIELIEETDDRTREEYWRLYYINLGCNLYNIKRGYVVFNTKEWYKEYYENNKELILEYQKEYKKKYRINNKQRIKEYQKEYYKKYRIKNKQRIKEYQKEYYNKKNKLKE